MEFAFLTATCCSRCMEALFARLLRELMGVELETPFPRMT